MLALIRGIINHENGAGYVADADILRSIGARGALPQHGRQLDRGEYPADQHPDARPRTPAASPDLRGGIGATRCSPVKATVGRTDAIHSLPQRPGCAWCAALPRTVVIPPSDGISGAVLDALAQAIAPIWGIYQGGELALEADSFVSLDFRNESRVSDYPQEPNTFASYNKVATPFDVRVRMAIAADRATRTNFLATCETMVRSVDLFDVVTPEATYLNATDQLRLPPRGAERRQHAGGGPGTARGPHCRAVDVLNERKSALPADQVKSVNGASPQSTGQVRAAAPTTAQAGAMQ